MKQFTIEQAMRGKKFIGYGAGLAFLGAQAAHPVTLSYLVDDTPELQGSRIHGIPVFPLRALQSEKRDEIFIIVYANTSKAVSAMCASLRRSGFAEGEHFSDCSLLHYDSMRGKLSDSLGIASRAGIFAKTRAISLSAAEDNVSSIAGTWLLIELLDSLPPRCAGDIAECGAYNGQNAFITLTLARGIGGRTYHLFDSFEGFPELSNSDPLSRRAEFADADFARVRQRFSDFPNVRIHKGFFSHTLPRCADLTFCMVYVDCDLYEPILCCCEFFYDRIPPGGYMLFHDYWFPEIEMPHRATFRGVKKAVDAFFRGREDRLLVFPETTHALIRKEGH